MLQPDFLSKIVTFWPFANSAPKIGVRVRDQGVRLRSQIRGRARVRFGNTVRIRDKVRVKG